MKYLVTGATGFVGVHLIKKLLSQDCEVYATSRRTNGNESDILDVLSLEEYKRIHWIFCDLLNQRSVINVLKTKYDGIFHLAAQSHPPTGFSLPFYTQDINVVGSLYLLEALSVLQPSTRFMFCSTSEVYGAPNLKKGEKITEDYPIRPINPYASSKAMIDLFFQERINNGYLNGFITRAFSHTGPRRGKIFSISSDAFQIAEILEGKLTLHKGGKPVIGVGNLNSVRAVMDVRDCVQAYYTLMRTGSTGIFNVGVEQGHKMSYFLEMMLDMNSLKVDLEVKEELYRKIDIPIQIPDTKKIYDHIGWVCTIPLKQTLHDLVNYWRMKIRLSK